MALISRYIITQRNTLFGQATNGKCTNKKIGSSQLHQVTRLLSKNKQLNQSLHSNKKKKTPQEGLPGRR